ncbi:hypothetical protein [Solimicrobium silvestre]|nr:hypothetical protein [Solimicrobium silvestre]
MQHPFVPVKPQEAKSILAYNQIKFDLLEASEAFKKIQFYNEKNPDDASTMRHLFSSGIALYGRCITTSESRGIHLNPQQIQKLGNEQYEIYKEMEVLRHSHVAHAGKGRNATTVMILLNPIGKPKVIVGVKALDMNFDPTNKSIALKFSDHCLKLIEIVDRCISLAEKSLLKIYEKQNIEDLYRHAKGSFIVEQS